MEELSQESHQTLPLEVVTGFFLGGRVVLGNRIEQRDLFDSDLQEVREKTLGTDLNDLVVHHHQHPVLDTPGAQQIEAATVLFGGGASVGIEASLVV